MVSVIIMTVCMLSIESDNYNGHCILHRLVVCNYYYYWNLEYNYCLLFSDNYIPIWNFDRNYCHFLSFEIFHAIG